MIFKTKIMKREIMFRGKWKSGYGDFNGGRWMYGSLLQKDGNAAIATAANIILDCYDDIDSSSSIPVKSSTVGQYTGLNDRNGTKIFEGDIIKCYKYIEGVEEITIAGYVVYGECGFYVKEANNDDGWRLCYLDPKTELEVVGNIFDNSDLLK